MTAPTNPTNRLHTYCRWPLDPAERRRLAIVDLHYVWVMRRVLFGEGDARSGKYPPSELDSVRLAAIDVLEKLQSEAMDGYQDL